VTGLILAEVFLVGIELFRGTGRPALSNRLFWITGALTLVLLVIFLYSPFVARMMQMAPISPHDWMEALLAAFLSTFAVEGVSRLLRLTRPG
jgi:magnesium-transporting ATPase (P-type)